MLTKPLTIHVRRSANHYPCNGRYVGTEFNRPISLVFMLLLLPVFLFNCVFCLVKGQKVLEVCKKTDCLGRSFHYSRFNAGILRNAPILWAVYNKRVSLCGVPIKLELSKQQRAQLMHYAYVPTGLIDAVTLHQASGLAAENKIVLLKKQFTSSRAAYLSLLLKASITKLLYSNTKAKLQIPTTFRLFGLNIHNDSMSEAVDWAVSSDSENEGLKRCKTGCFVNVNSVNLSVTHPELATSINSVDRCFADGSGLRLAANKEGINIKDNVNGTDMLPHLCKAAQAKGTSIYLLGAKPGVALAMERNLRKQYPTLRIAGAEHGYFDRNEDASVVERINRSNAGILLLAMGSPVQEQWLVDNASKLNCSSALAVGGLFDFYSGKIPRAPMWMRELGLEWVWRLIQEPKSKFHRYVIGNPLFLIRTFVFNRGSRGF